MSVWKRFGFHGESPVSATFPLIGTLQNGAAAPATASGGAVVISGTPGAGETVTVSLGTSTHVHVVREVVPLAEIAAGLAAMINVDSAVTGFIASVDGDTLVVVDTNTVLTTPSFSLTSTAGSVTQTTVSATTRFALAGTARIGDVWQVTVGAHAPYVYEVESPEVIAALLAADINATGYVVRATLTAPPVPAVGEVWAVSVEVGGVLAKVGYAVLAGDDLADVMAGLAKALNLLGRSQFTARADGGDLILVNHTSSLPVVAFKQDDTPLTKTMTIVNFVASADGATIVIVPLAGTFPTVLANAATEAARNSLTGKVASVVTITPSANPVAGEVWKVEIGATAVYRHVVAGAETVTQILASLAARINTGAATGFTAFADGDVLVIVRADGVTFTPTFTVAPAASIVLDAVTPTSQLVSFGAQGTTIEGETWYVLVATPDAVFAYGYKIVAGDDIGDITIALAAAINADTEGGFTAIAPATGGLFIVDRAGRKLTASFEIGLADGTRGGGAVLLTLAPAPIPAPPADPDPTQTAKVTLSGTPAAGEVWNIVLTESVGGNTIEHAYSSQVRDTVPLAEIAAGLAAMINASGTGFVASVVGDTLVVEGASALGALASYVSMKLLSVRRLIVSMFETGPRTVRPKGCPAKQVADTLLHKIPAGLS